MTRQKMLTTKVKKCPRTVAAITLMRAICAIEMFIYEVECAILLWSRYILEAIKRASILNLIFSRVRFNKVKG